MAENEKVKFHLGLGPSGFVQKKVDPRLIAAAVAAILLLGLNLGLAIASATTLRETSTQVVRTQSILVGLERTLLHAVDCETGQRGYLITRDESFLGPYESALQDIGGDFRSLEDLLKTDPGQLQALQSIRSKWEDRLAFLREGIAIRRDTPVEDNTPVRTFIGAKKGKLEMDELRRMISAMEGHFDKELVRHQETALAAYYRSVVTSIIAGLIAIIGVIVCISLFVRSIRIRDRDAAIIHEQRELLATTLESIGDAVITTDADAKVTFLNRVAEGLTGWHNSDARGRDLEAIFNIVNEHTRGPVQNPALRALKEGIIVGLANHTILIGRDGSEVPIDDSAAPIRTSKGLVAGSVLIFRDISDRKRTEDDLRRIAADLSEADRRKDEFLATLAHELRNPLAPVLNAVELLKFHGSDEEIIGVSREVIERQVTHLTRLIDDLLDLSRITRNKLDLHFERVQLDEVVSSAVEASRPLIAQHVHQLTVEVPSEPIILRADSIRLSQVLTNLLNNAAKYTPDNGRIELQVRPLGTTVEISIKDNGIGIPAENQERLFEMFYQVDRSLERSHSGLGIGLALVRRLTELHGGSVEARSDGRGKGSEFIVTLPIAEAAPTPVEVDADSASPLVNRRILLADDNQDIVATLSMLLRALDNEVFTASDGNEALAQAERHSPEIILLDIGMPKLNGYEVCRELRSHGGFDSAIIVALTGWGQDEDRERSREAGFDAHLVKPVERSILERTLREIEASRSAN